MRLLIVLIILIVFSPNAESMLCPSAQSGDFDQPRKNVAARSDFIFVARVVHIEESFIEKEGYSKNTKQQKIKFSVKSQLKGSIPQEVVVRNGWGFWECGCWYKFKLGGFYIVNARNTIDDMILDYCDFIEALDAENLEGKVKDMEQAIEAVEAVK